MLRVSAGAKTGRYPPAATPLREMRLRGLYDACFSADSSKRRGKGAVRIVSAIMTGFSAGICFEVWWYHRDGATGHREEFGWGLHAMSMQEEYRGVS